MDSQAQTGRDPEAVPTRMALAVPGFGGFAFDTGNGDLIIWVKDPKRAPAARAAVTEYLAKNYRGPGGRAGPNPPVRIQIGNFDFLELGSMRDRVSEVLATEGGLRGIGIDVFTNRVHVDADENAVQRIGKILEDAGVPRGAVWIQGVPRPTDGSWDPDDPTTFPLRLPEPADSV